MPAVSTTTAAANRLNLDICIGLLHCTACAISSIGTRDAAMPRSRTDEILTTRSIVLYWPLVQHVESDIRTTALPSAFDDLAADHGIQNRWWWSRPPPATHRTVPA